MKNKINVGQMPADLMNVRAWLSAHGVATSTPATPAEIPLRWTECLARPWRMRALPAGTLQIEQDEVTT